MTVQLNVAEAKAKLSELIERAEAGEEVIIARAGKPVVRLTAVTPADRKLGLFSHLGPLPADVCDPDPLDAMYAEQSIEEDLAEIDPIPGKHLRQLREES